MGKAAAESAKRIRAAPANFRLHIGDEGEHQFTLRRKMFVLGVPPNQADVLAFLDGCEFEQAWRRRVDAEPRHVLVSLLSLENDVLTRKAFGRDKDLRDSGELRKVLGYLPGDEPAP